MLTRTLRRLLRRPSAAAAKPYGRLADRDSYVDLRDRFDGDSPVVVDGGAHSGAITDLFLRHFRSPRIHAFEPIPALATELRRRYAGRPEVTVWEHALGDEARQVGFHLAENGVSSSVLAPGGALRRYHGAKVSVRQELQVSQVRLEDVVPEVDILKLDLQGYELQALRGCGSLLPRIRMILTEVEFLPCYEGQAVFSDIDLFLRGAGFRLLNLYDLYTQPDGQLTAADALYLNERFFE